MIWLTKRPVCACMCVCVRTMAFACMPSPQYKMFWLRRPGTGPSLWTGVTSVSLLHNSSGWLALTHGPKLNLHRVTQTHMHGNADSALSIYYVHFHDMQPLLIYTSTTYGIFCSCEETSVSATETNTLKLLSLLLLLLLFLSRIFSCFNTHLFGLRNAAGTLWLWSLTPLLLVPCSAADAGNEAFMSHSLSCLHFSF